MNSLATVRYRRRKQAETQVHNLTRLYATLSQINHTLVRARDRCELFESICRVAVEFGEFRLAWIGVFDVESGVLTPAAAHGQQVPFDSINAYQMPWKEGIIGRALRSGRIRFSHQLRADQRMAHWHAVALQEGYAAAAAVPFRVKGQVSGLLNLYAAQAGIFTREEEQRLLEEMSLDISFALDGLAVEAERKQAEAALRASEARYRSTLDSLQEGLQIIGPDWRYLYINEAAARHGRRTTPELLGRTMMEMYPGIEHTELFTALRSCMEERTVRQMENEFTYPDGRKGWFELSIEPVPEGIVVISLDVTLRKQAEAQSQQHVAELEVINRISNELRTVQTLDELLPLLLDETLAIFQTTSGSLWLYEPAAEELRRVVARGWVAQFAESQPASEGIVGQVFTTGEPYLAQDLRTDARTYEAVRPAIPSDWAGLVVPVRDAAVIIGTLSVTLPPPRAFSTTDVGLVSTIAAIAGSAIHRMRLHQQTEQRLQRLSALRSMDLAILNSMDLRITLSILIQQVRDQLQVDAAAVLLLKDHAGVLEYAAGVGFRGKGIERARLRLGEGYAGRAARERRTVHIADIRQPSADAVGVSLIAGEDFVTFYGVPLLVKGQVKGVLEVFQRAPFTADAEWLEFFETLAGQAAIAIDNAQLFERLQRSNLDLTLAYDTAIEGWSRALDLRDKETEGHTQRVTEITMRLAKAMGIEGAEMAHIRRGALLHDMGKMGVPDQILLKPGPLTDEEWVLMRKHPTFAYELLLPISYLRPALDIPHYHHEKWDGTGYPEGLKGQQIPLAARIFAVVDVWDALRSDRPYRAAWPEDKVREHVRSLIATHFDPEVVDAFLRLEMDEGVPH